MQTQFCVCLSHDVDRIKKSFQFFTHFFKCIKNGDLESATYQLKSLFKKSHYWNFQKIMDIEKKLGLRSSFFFLNETYPFNPFKIASWRLSLGYYNLLDPHLGKVIRDLDDQGWEVGLHGSYLSYKDLELLRKEKGDLEGIIGHAVMGVRQHYLNLDRHTWKKQATAGFFYDASFGFTDNIGFKEDRYYPFSPIPNRAFKVVPLALMDSCVMKNTNAFVEAVKVINLAAEKRACLVLNWHQRVFNEKEFPGYLSMYLRLIGECRKRNARFLTIGEYINIADEMQSAKMGIS
jgi:peptidoglycan/xylan/chitin deacetylase (PgdA/CDA1 family)